MMNSTEEDRTCVCCTPQHCSLSPSPRGKCVFCGYSELPEYPLVALPYTGPCSKCRLGTVANVLYHQRCFNAVKSCHPQRGNTLVEDMYRLSVCTRPLYYPRTTLDDVRLLALSPEYAKLPPELWRQVLAHLVPFPELVALKQIPRMRSQIHRLNAPSDSVVFARLEGWLYLTIIQILGTQYICRIGNYPPPDDQYYRKLELNKGWMIICRDHLGIRDISLCEHTYHGKRDRGLYYSSVDLITGDASASVLIGETDGLFLRTLFFRKAPYPAKSLVLEEWNTPCHPPMDQFIRLSNVSDALSHPARLHYLPLENHLEGLTACARAGKTVGLYVHQPGGEYHSFISELNAYFEMKDLVFIHFPIAVDETVREVGIRRIATSQGPASFPVLTLATSSGRGCVFGPYINPTAQAHFEFHTVRSEAGHFLGIYHSAVDNLTAAFNEIGILKPDNFETKILTSTWRFTDYLSPRSGTPNRDWYLSTVTLDGVISLRVCEESCGEQRHCLGLLFTYQDGHKKSLGQFRFDKELSKDIALDGCEFSLNDLRGMPAVVRRMSVPGRADKSWRQLPCRGIALWWFGTKGDVLKFGSDLYRQ